MNRYRPLRYFLVNVVSGLLLLPVPPARADTPSLLTAGELLLRFKDQDAFGSRCDKPRVAELARRHGLAISAIRDIAGGSCSLQLQSPQNEAKLNNIIQALRKEPDIHFVDPNDLLSNDLTQQNAPQRLHYPLSDTQYQTGAQWYLDDPLVGINVAEAWRTTAGSPAVTVALLDSGVLTHHPELSGRLLPGYDTVQLIDQKMIPPFDIHLRLMCLWWKQERGETTCATLFSGDGDGPDNDPSDPGDWHYRYTYEGPVIDPSLWHGTAVAGLLGARNNDATGLAGVAGHSMLLPVRVTGRGSAVSDLINGLHWAGGLPVPDAPMNEHPAQVISMSLGIPGDCPASVQTSIDTLLDSSPVRAIVAAVGNTGGDAMEQWPANCKRVIAVGSVGRDGHLAPYSNHGPRVTISAPAPVWPALGETRQTLFPLLANCSLTTPIYRAGDCPDQARPGIPFPYRHATGTSYSVPLVSGTIALMLSANRTLTANGILHYLTSTARPYPEGSNCHGRYRCGAGLLDAGQAVMAVARLPGGIAYPLRKRRAP